MKIRSWEDPDPFKTELKITLWSFQMDSILDAYKQLFRKSYQIFERILKLDKLFLFCHKLINKKKVNGSGGEQAARAMHVEQYLAGGALNWGWSEERVKTLTRRQMQIQHHWILLLTLWKQKHFVWLHKRTYFLFISFFISFYFSRVSS